MNTQVTLHQEKELKLRKPQFVVLAARQRKTKKTIPIIERESEKFSAQQKSLSRGGWETGTHDEPRVLNV